MTFTRRPGKRSRTSRWLLGVVVAAAVTFVVPGIADGATATADPATAVQPAGEVTPTTTASTTTDPATTDPGAQTPPATDPSTGSAGDETPAPDTTLGPDGGSTAAPAPSSDTTSAPAPSPSGTEATPTPAPAPSISTPAPAPSVLPVTPDTPAGTGTASGAALTAPPAPVAPHVVMGTPAVAVPADAPDRPTSAAPAATHPKRVVPPAVKVQDFVAALLGPRSPQQVVAPSPADSGPDAGALADDTTPPTVALEAAHLVAPMGAPSDGASLLAVLAGYVLPGGGAPASTLVLFIVLGLVLGLSAAACPRGLERLAALMLLGSSEGHERAVARPG